MELYDSGLFDKLPSDDPLWEINNLVNKEIDNCFITPSELWKHDDNLCDRKPCNLEIKGSRKELKPFQDWSEKEIAIHQMSKQWHDEHKGG